MSTMCVYLSMFQHMEVNYSFGDDTVTMDVTVDADNNIIHYYLPEDDFFEEMETIDDFYAVSAISTTSELFLLKYLHLGNLPKT